MHAANSNAKKLKLMNEYASQARIPLALRFVKMAYFLNCVTVQLLIQLALMSTLFLQLRFKKRKNKEKSRHTIFFNHSKSNHRLKAAGTVVLGEMFASRLERLKTE